MLNTKLYQKMFTEQELFKAVLMLLPPTEVLDRTNEYVCRKDILMALEHNDLSYRQALTLLKSPTPLADVFKKWDNWEESHHMENIWNAVEPVPMKWYGLILLKLGELRGDVPWYTFHQR